MALIVENGTQVPQANTYIDIAFADQYHATYGNEDWAGGDTDKERALVVAAQALDLLYGSKYVSFPLASTQALLWPRYPFTDTWGNTRLSSVIPVELKRAQAEIALMYMTGVNVFPEGNTKSSIASESVAVGDITTSTTYKNGERPEQATYEGFRKVDLLLTPIVKRRSSVVFLSR